MSTPPDDFLAQWARTRQFTLGVPRLFTVSPDGRLVLFCRTRSGDDPVSCLWVYDTDAGTERLLADPAALPEGADDPTPEERTRRERLRERSTGITAFATDARVRRAAFAVSGRLSSVDVATGDVRALPTADPVSDPRPDPTGTAIAYASAGGLHVIDVGTAVTSTLAAPEDANVTYGLAEHVAAESMARHRGFWWAPDGERLVAARVDTGPVQRWYLADPTNPATPPTQLAYPAAGTANAVVTLHVLGRDGSRVDVAWDRTAFEYVVAVDWSAGGLLVAVQDRSQTRLRLLAVDPDTGRTETVHEARDPKWVTIVPGVPTRTAGGAVVWVGDRDDTRELVVAGRAVTPPGLQVRSVLGVAGERVLFVASYEQREDHVWEHTPEHGCRALSDGPGVHTAAGGGDTTVLTSRTVDSTTVRVRVRRPGLPDAEITSHAERPVLDPRPRFLDAGARGIRTAVLLPSWHVAGRRLPVLLDPYGGPSGRRVLADRGAYLSSQWWAEQGYAVVIADGAGTPGRSPAWERSVHRDMADLVLADQVRALHAAADTVADLDLTRVAIRGWSFSGFLATLAVLRRPDVFRAAVAGAPVTDRRLYDTHYQERYLGQPHDEPDVYARNSLLADAPSLTRPLLLIHGLLDDNVVPAHSLRLAAALRAAGRPHELVLLPGTSHLPTDVATVTALFRMQADFLRRALSDRSTGP